MIDEMTAMNKEISKLKAEVGVLRGALADMLEIVNLQETYGFSGEVAEMWHLAHQKIENARNLAANVTSEAPQASEPAFKVGDKVIFTDEDTYTVCDIDDMQKGGLILRVENERDVFDAHEMFFRKA